MDKQQRQKFSPEVRERAVRMVIEHRGDHASQWAAIVSIAAKIGCTAQTTGWPRLRGTRAVALAPRQTNASGSRRWNARTVSFAKPMRFCARPQRILTR